MPARAAAGGAVTALARGFEAGLRGSRGDLASAQRCAFEAIERLRSPAPDMVDRVAAVACAAALIALDAGNHRLAAQALTLPLGNVRCARHRVHAEVAAAGAFFMAGDWEGARDRLQVAWRTCLQPEARQLVGLPIGLGVELAMAMEDDEALHWSWVQIDALPSGLAQATTAVARLRGRAWEALRAGRRGQALERLLALCASPHQSRAHGISRLDAAWLAFEAGRIDEADRLAVSARRWVDGSPLGRALQALRLQAKHDDAHAGAAWLQARRDWPVRWPARWTDRVAGDSAGRTLPSAELRGLFYFGPPP